VSGAGLVGPPHGPGAHYGRSARRERERLCVGQGARACRRRDGVAVIRYNLHSARRSLPGQATSVRDPSNKELKLTPGSVA
jgi:hypothetical protein